jgi:hypothetical protein
MFANVCTSCGKRQLVFADQIRGLQQTDHGFAVRYECTCGAIQTWRVERDSAPVVSSAA